MIKSKYIVIIILSLAFFGFGKSTCNKTDDGSFDNSKESPLKGNNNIQKAWEIQSSFREIYDLYQDRVVFISTEQTVKHPQHPFFSDPFFRQFFGLPRGQKKQRKKTGLGTGFILSEDGYICTNNHVIAGVDKVTVRIEKKSYIATIIGTDRITDIALLKIKPGSSLNPVHLGDSDKVRVGDWAIAIGNPFGLDKTFTVGVISATSRRDLRVAGGSNSHIQTDASINPGNSGGPLINIRGEVIGINRMIYSRSGGSLGIGFAIPINTAKQILGQLKKYHKVKRGYIGIKIVPLTEEYMRNLGIKEKRGALVGGIVRNGPAHQAGLLPGDLIIEVDGHKISEYQELISILRKNKIGKIVSITVLRKGTTLNLSVKIAEK